MKNVRFSRNGVEFEPTKQELKIVLDDYAKQLGEKDKRIAELEEENEIYKKALRGEVFINYKIPMENERLKQELAEKDTQIQSQKKNLEFFYDVFNNSERYQIFSDINQAKTDFAIEQLEKMEYDLLDISNGWWLCFKDGTQYMTHLELEGCVREVINKQIQELKGE